MEEATRAASRRNVMRMGAAVIGTAGAAALAGAAGAGTAFAQAAPAGKTFVLVHGAWHGGWCFRRVADRLTAAGHKVHTPTMTGLGERSNLLAKGIDVDTHVTDIANVLEWEDLRNVVLCGHSYAGFVISGVAARRPGAIASIVYLDAFLPEDGQAVVDLATPKGREQFLAAQQRGDIAVPPLPAAYFMVNDKDQAWVNGKCTPQPVATFTQKVTGTGARQAIARKTYIRSSRYASPAFDAAYDTLRKNRGWRVYKVEAGHDVMVDNPARLAEIRQKVA